MAKLEDDTDALRREADRLYRAYGETRAAYRRDRKNAELQAALRRIRARYEAIEAELSKRTGSREDGDGPIPELDMSQFEVSELRYRPPAVVSGAEEDARGRRRRNILIARTLIAGALLIVLVGVLLQISSQRLGFYAVPSRSMEPTLKPGDKLVAYADAFYLRGDIVVLQDPRSPEEFLVKRVVGIPGDRVEVYDRKLRVNGVAVEEPYLQEAVEYRMAPILVGEGELFVLGDNRNQSEDGHVWKRAVPADTVMGRVRYIYSPAPRRGAIASQVSAFDGVP